MDTVTTMRAWVVVDETLANDPEEAAIVYKPSPRAAFLAAPKAYFHEGGGKGDVDAKHAVARKGFALTVIDATPGDLALPCDTLHKPHRATLDGALGAYLVYPLGQVALDLDDLPSIHTTREAWFQAFVTGARSVFGAGDLPALPERVRVGCGYPSKGAKSRALGECWHSTNVADGAREIIMRPDHGQHHVGKMTPTLVHELLHAALPDDAGHGPDFRRRMPLVGIVGDAKSTEGGVDFLRIWGGVLRECGSFPQPEVKMAPMQEKKQTTRMRKCWCASESCDTWDVEREAGYLCRTTAQWLDSYGPPVCPCCGAQMLTDEGTGGEEGEP